MKKYKFLCKFYIFKAINNDVNRKKHNNTKRTSVKNNLKTCKLG